MRMYENLDDLSREISSVAKYKDGKLVITDKSLLKEKLLDKLVWSYVFSEDAKIKEAIAWFIRGASLELGSIPSSIHDFYKAVGSGKIKCDFTVPAINIRGVTYELACKVFEVAMNNNSGSFIFEIARSEIGYTKQTPEEYATCVLAAAIKTGYVGPVFIQGDHFQVNLKKYQKDPQGEINTIKKLIADSIKSSFYNIDIDTSTLVDLTKPTVKEQQRLNFEICADLTEFIRQNEPKGITISVGGEIGEIGGKNSTVEELDVFVSEYNNVLQKKNKLYAGLSKISVQTGATHGGIPLPDGTLARVAIDFDTLRNLSKAAREKFQLGGAVQHGASTLPEEYFNKFPETGTIEIHLATAYQNAILDAPSFPVELKQKMYKYLKENFASEQKPGQTDEQFYYKTRKNVFGAFKRELWNLPAEVKSEFLTTIQNQFNFLFKKLNVINNYSQINKFVKQVKVEHNKPAFLNL